MFNSTTIIFLLILLVILIFLSGFFSASETGIMTINRYRLKHMANSGSPTARQVIKLLEHPDKLLAIILIGNTLSNVFASSIATLLAIHWWGDLGVAIATGALTFIILIGAEILPKTFAAVYPQTVSFLVVWPLSSLLWLLYPFVFCMNLLVNGILALFSIRVNKKMIEHLNADELRTIVYEAAGVMPTKHRDMLLNLLDLEKMTVEDVMIPRHDIIGLDLEDEWEDIVGVLSTYPGERLPVYRKTIDDIVGILDMQRLLGLSMSGAMNKQVLESLLLHPYFVPEKTSLLKQLASFQKKKRVYALVVDEYGDIQGFVTLADILEEIVGDYAIDQYMLDKDIYPQEDGSFLVDGGITIRELNKALNWHFPLRGPKTLNGIIMEHLESMPQIKTCIKILDYTIEIVQVKDNCVKTAKVFEVKKNKI
jgi:Mg2+/Co2+ transporter CorB